MAEHWFDRLAAPHTRRQGLKAALAGATMALPLARAGSHALAAADTPARAASGACRQGCLYTAGRNYGRKSSGCIASGYFGGIGSAAYNFVVSPPLAIVSNMVYGKRQRRCLDSAYITYRFDSLECSKPQCGSFNPYEEGGPCDGCPEGYYCNPCAKVETGYICCVYKAGDCHGDCCNAGTGCP